MMVTHDMTRENVEKVLLNAQHYYTPEAWLEYGEYLKSQGVIERVKRNQWMVSTGIERSPIIEKKIDATWTVQLPLLINYQSTGSYHLEKQAVTLNIANSPRCHLKITHITIV